MHHQQQRKWWWQRLATTAAIVVVGVVTMARGEEFVNKMSLGVCCDTGGLDIELWDVTGDILVDWPLTFDRLGYGVNHCVETTELTSDVRKPAPKVLLKLSEAFGNEDLGKFDGNMFRNTRWPTFMQGEMACAKIEVSTLSATKMERKAKIPAFLEQDFRRMSHTGEAEVVLSVGRLKVHGTRKGTYTPRKEKHYDLLSKVLKKCFYWTDEQALGRLVVYGDVERLAESFLDNYDDDSEDDHVGIEESSAKTKSSASSSSSSSSAVATRKPPPFPSSEMMVRYLEYATKKRVVRNGGVDRLLFRRHLNRVMTFDDVEKIDFGKVYSNLKEDIQCHLTPGCSLGIRQPKVERFIASMSGILTSFEELQRKANPQMTFSKADVYIKFLSTERLERTWRVVPELLLQSAQQFKEVSAVGTERKGSRRLSAASRRTSTESILGRSANLFKGLESAKNILGQAVSRINFGLTSSVRRFSDGGADPTAFSTTARSESSGGGHPSRERLRTRSEGDQQCVSLIESNARRSGSKGSRRSRGSSRSHPGRSRSLSRGNVDDNLSASRKMVKGKEDASGSSNSGGGEVFAYVPRERMSTEERLRRIRSDPLREWTEKRRMPSDTESRIGTVDARSVLSDGEADGKDGQGVTFERALRYLMLTSWFHGDLARAMERHMGGAIITMLAGWKISSTLALCSSAKFPKDWNRVQSNKLADHWKLPSCIRFTSKRIFNGSPHDYHKGIHFSEKQFCRFLAVPGVASKDLEAGTLPLTVDVYIIDAMMAPEAKTDRKAFSGGLYSAVRNAVALPNTPGKEVVKAVKNVLPVQEWQFAP